MEIKSSEIWVETVEKYQFAYTSFHMYQFCSVWLFIQVFEDKNPIDHVEINTVKTVLLTLTGPQLFVKVTVQLR